MISGLRAGLLENHLYKKKLLPHSRFSTVCHLASDKIAHRQRNARNGASPNVRGRNSDMPYFILFLYNMMDRERSNGLMTF